jgi:hypothetical protein
MDSMNADMRRARALAGCLDLLIPAAIADAIALLLTAAVWYVAPGSRPDVWWIWIPAGLAALLAFLLRDSRGGRARRWLALEVRGAGCRAPGRWASIRRNLPLLVPGWNLLEIWPILRDGQASRRFDRRRGLEVAWCD